MLEEVLHRELHCLVKLRVPARRRDRHKQLLLQQVLVDAFWLKRKRLMQLIVEPVHPHQVLRLKDAKYLVADRVRDVDLLARHLTRIIDQHHDLVDVY